MVSEMEIEAACKAFLAEYGDPSAEWWDYRKEVTAALEAAARVRAEDNAPQPVAWLTRYQHKGREQITVAPTSAASSVPHGRHKLYLEPAPQPSGTVEALEWRTHKGDEFCFVHYDADAIGGSYCIEERKTGDFDLWTPGKSDGARFDTLEAAQAAAQADHERRIRSALTAGGGE